MSAPTRTSRRSFLLLGALAAVVPKRLRAQSVRVGKQRFQTVQQLEVPAVPATWKDPVARLVRRATYGLAAADLANARKLGYQEWLNQQLRYTRIADDALNANLATRYPQLSQTVDQLYQVDTGTVTTLMQQSTIYRAVYSQRQLYERMVEFWSDHFNIYVGKVGYLKIVDDREVIRKYAMSSFPKLLAASAKSPAMLAYLDQTASRSGRPNQNYAREVMELHTLGVDGGYTQNDVAELSRVLTGWTITGRGLFFFDPTGHDWGAKTVLGMTIPAGSPSQGQDGVKEGERVFDILVAHPSTARFIAKKMIAWLLNAEPTDAQVRTISAVYRSTGGDITAMVRAILNDAWLSAAPAKYKRPFHFLVSGARAVGVTLTTTDALNRQLATLGQSLFSWQTPDGFPDSIAYWAGNITPRWSFGSALSAYNSAAIAIDATPFLTGGVNATVETINQRIFGGDMSATTRTALSGYLAAGTYAETRIRETVGLAIGASDFQWY